MYEDNISSSGASLYTLFSLSLSFPLPPTTKQPHKNSLPTPTCPTASLNWFASLS